MRVLVTGHNGYIGTVMVPMLRAAGHGVAGLDSDYFEPCLLAGQDVPDRVPATPKDLRDVTAADLEGIDAVIHLGGLSNDPLGNLDAGLTEEINDTASVRLAELAKAAGVRRFLFSSSCSTYGAADPDDLLDEQAAFKPVTPYAVAKVRMEQRLAEMAGDDFSPTYLRNATAYGVSPRLRIDLVLNNLVASAFATGEILMLSDGTPWRPMVHVEDICRAFLAILAAPREATHNQAYNVGRSEENYRIRELAEIVAETVPGSRITYAADAGPDKRCYRVDFSKIERLPGFEPRWDARRGARELFDAYRLAGLTREELHGPRFVRLSRIKELQEAGRLDARLRWRQAVPT